MTTMSTALSSLALLEMTLMDTTLLIQWYWSIITWLLDVTVQNAWQLHKKAGGFLTSLEFRQEVTAVLLIHGSRNRISQNFLSTGPIGIKHGEMDLRYDNISHFIKRRKHPRRLCALQGCMSKVLTYCTKCDRTICIDHFEIYHTR